MIEQGITKQQILTELAKSPHGKLEAYLAIGHVAARQEPEFLSHLISWNRDHGQIRDAKTALPVVYLAAATSTDESYVDNAVAHLAMLDVRNFLKAFRFAKSLSGFIGVSPAAREVFGVTAEEAMLGMRVQEITIPGTVQRGPARPGKINQFRKLVVRYLRAREANWGWWEKSAVQHRSSLKELYGLCHVKPTPMADQILFKENYPRGSVFEAIHELKNMGALEAAGTIAQRKIPAMIALGALGSKSKDVDIALALINRMSPSELVNNTTMLQGMGMKANPALRAAYEEALVRAGSSKKNTLKATVVAEDMDLDIDDSTREKLKSLQEKQIKALGGVDGNWLVLADKSGSMSSAIEAGRHIAATLAKMVNGKVWLVFFDTFPRRTEVTGMTYEEIRNKTLGVKAGGGTSIGCGLLGMLEANIEVDGIAIVSDGGDNTVPFFTDTYKRYTEKFSKEPPVYLYELDGGDPNHLSGFMKTAKYDLQVFNLRGKSVDYYALPNLVQTMRVNRYGLVQQILDTPLLRLDDILPPVKEVRHGAHFATA